MTTSPTQGRLGYRPQLDGLRGWTTIFVFTYHAIYWPYGATVALSTFFVQSGFLITTILLEERDFKGGIRLKRFYGRRALRIFPALLVFLALYTIAALIIGGNKMGVRLEAVFYGLTYLTNWVLAYGHPYPAAEVGPLWSLSIEEQFYALWPVSLVIALRLGWRKAAPWLLAIGIVAIFIWRFQLGYRGATGYRLFFGSDVRFDDLFIGCWLAFAYREGWLTSERGKKILGILIWPAVTVWLGLLFLIPQGIVLEARVFKYMGGLSLAAWSAAIGIAWLVVSDTSRLARLFSHRALIVYGVASYSVYLYHAPVILWTRDYAPDFIRAAPLLFSIPITAVLATVSHILVERPFLRLKDRYSTVKHTAASESAALADPNAPPV